MIPTIHTQRKSSVPDPVKYRPNTDRGNSLKNLPTTHRKVQESCPHCRMEVLYGWQTEKSKLLSNPFSKTVKTCTWLCWLTGPLPSLERIQPIATSHELSTSVNDSYNSYPKKVKCSWPSKVRPNTDRGNSLKNLPTTHRKVQESCPHCRMKVLYGWQTEKSKLLSSNRLHPEALKL